MLYNQTHQRTEERTCRRRDFPLAPHEDRVGLAVKFATERSDPEVVHGADHVVEAHEVGAPEKAKDDGAEERSNESFHCLLGREFDEGCSSKGDAANISENVIADYQRRWHPEPYQPFQDVVDNEMADKINVQRGTFPSDKEPRT